MIEATNDRITSDYPLADVLSGGRLSRSTVRFSSDTRHPARGRDHVLEREIQEHDRRARRNGRTPSDVRVHARASLSAHFDGERSEAQLGRTRGPVRKVRETSNSI